MKFSIKNFQQMRPNPQFPVDLALFTEEIRNLKLQLLCSVSMLQSKGIEIFLRLVKITKTLLICKKNVEVITLHQKELSYVLPHLSYFPSEVFTLYP